MKWLILLAVLLAIVFVLGMRIGAGKQGGSVAFTPVHELPETQRRPIDGALDNNQKILALQLKPKPHKSSQIEEGDQKTNATH